MDNHTERDTSLTGSRVLVVGATGTQGAAVARALAARGALVLGASRSGAYSPVGRAVALDLAAASPGVPDVDAAFVYLPMTFGAPGDARRIQPLIDALSARGARIVFSSSGPLADEPIGVPPADEKLAAARAVLATGRGVVLRATLFMENLSAPWSAPLVREGDLVYPLAPETRVRWVSNRDVGAAVAGALVRPGAVGRSFTIAGPELLDFHGVAERLSRGLGQQVRYRRIAPREFGARLGRYLGEAIGTAIGSAYEATPPGDNPVLGLDGAAAAEELGFRQTTLEAWARTESWYDAPQARAAA